MKLGLLVISLHLFSSAWGKEVFQDSTATDSIVKKKSLVIGINRGSDAIFFGRTSPTTFPYYSTDIVYNSKNGFFAYGSVWHITSSSPFVNELDAGAGFLYRLTGWLSGNVSYTHFFTDKHIKIIKSNSLNDLDLKNTADLGIVKVSLTADYLFGKASDIFLTGSASRRFEMLHRLVDNRDYLTLIPSISVIYGTQNFVQQFNDDFAGARTNKNLDSEASFDQRRNTEFTPLNYSLRVPLAYNRPHYTIEASYKYSVPVNVERTLRNRRESFWYLRFYYLFF